MDQQNLLGLMALGDAFGSLGAIGGGNPGPQRALPFAIQMGQEQEKRQRAMDALRQSGQLEGNPALAALAGYDPDMVAGQLAQAQFQRPEQASPWANYKVVGNQVLGMGPEGPSPVYTAPQEPPSDPLAALRARAAEARLQPGTPEYEAFMLRGGAAETPKTADPFDRAGKLRDDFRAEPAFKVFSDVQDAAKRIGMFYQNPGAVSDYGLAVAFAKIVDPGSVAREGEVAAVQGSGALSQSMKQSLVNAINGEGALPPQMREEIVRLAEGFYKEQAQKYQQTYNEYQGRAERFGIDPRDALPDPLQSLSLRPAAPVTPVDRLPDLLRGSPPTLLRHPDTGETIYWDGTKIAPVPQ